MRASERSNLLENDERKELENEGALENDGQKSLENERAAMLVCAYLDGVLAGEDEEEFARLMNDEAFAREVRELEKIELSLREVGREVLNEGVPASLLDIISR
jgi:anti-sigma factor RsiW